MPRAVLGQLHLIPGGHSQVLSRGILKFGGRSTRHAGSFPQKPRMKGTLWRVLFGGLPPTILGVPFSNSKLCPALVSGEQQTTT